MARDPKMLKELHDSYAIVQLNERRKEQLQILAMWEKEINDLSAEAPISVVNNVDLESRPLDFVYTDRNLFGNSINKECLKALTGCDCTNCLKVRCECACRDDFTLGYNINRKLKVKKGTPIYECTSLCKCGPDCGNRVLQNGRTTPLCIFKTSNARGWGVSTFETIHKGQFVTEYVGEVITMQESYSRGKYYRRKGKTYLPL